MAQALSAMTGDIYALSISGIEQEPFPAKTKQAAGLVSGTETDISSISFSDKIMVTISQAGRLSQWIQVPLSTASPTAFDTALPTIGEDALPASHISPKTLLGAGGDEREMMGHLIASQLASLILRKEPGETRTIVVGVGLLKVGLDRDAWFDLLELIAKVV